ncbi:hypothetical protein L204_100726 [Cryptococcus depauperatus]|nr:riboflavin kinase [Cryptococcus depauperatus CBS 7855]
MPPKAEMASLSSLNRPAIVGPDTPEDPYPIHLQGNVTKGFGRGARFLGIPTANLPDDSLGRLNQLGMTGIYYGFARVHPTSSTPLPTPHPSAPPTAPSSPPRSNTDIPFSSATSGASTQGELQVLSTITAPYPPGHNAQRWSKEDEQVWPMVMSVGWNPYFKNEKITAEVHIIHPFKADFYGHPMSVLVLGYIRPEFDYVSKEALIEDIQTDVKVALNCLARPAYAALAKDRFLTEDNVLQTI